LVRFSPETGCRIIPKQDTDTGFLVNSDTFRVPGHTVLLQKGFHRGFPNYSFAIKFIYLSLGFLFFGMGVIGAFLPGLPTTPLMLLALWMFARSSQRFHDWLYHHRIFGPPLQRWKQYRIIPVRAKILSISMMGLSFGYLLWGRETGRWVLWIVGLVMAYGAWFILSKPSKRPMGGEA